MSKDSWYSGLLSGVQRWMDPLYRSVNTVNPEWGHKLNHFTTGTLPTWGNERVGAVDKPVNDFDRDHGPFHGNKKVRDWRNNVHDHPVDIAATVAAIYFGGGAASSYFGGGSAGAGAGASGGLEAGGAGAGLGMGAEAGGAGGAEAGGLGAGSMSMGAETGGSGAGGAGGMNWMKMAQGMMGGGKGKPQPSPHSNPVDYSVDGGTAAVAGTASGALAQRYAADPRPADRAAAEADSPAPRASDVVGVSRSGNATINGMPVTAATGQAVDTASDSRTPLMGSGIERGAGTEPDTPSYRGLTSAETEAIYGTGGYGDKSYLYGSFDQTGDGSTRPDGGVYDGSVADYQALESDTGGLYGEYGDYGQGNTNAGGSAGGTDWGAIAAKFGQGMAKGGAGGKGGATPNPHSNHVDYTVEASQVAPTLTSRFVDSDVGIKVPARSGPSRLGHPVDVNGAQMAAIQQLAARIDGLNKRIAAVRSRKGN